MKKEKHWCLMNAQRPPSAHLSVTHETIDTWKDFVASLKHCVQMMKKDPSLNQNEDTALYGMTGMIPDKSLLRKFVFMHQSAMLDTLE